MGSGAALQLQFFPAGPAPCANPAPWTKSPPPSWRISGFRPRLLPGLAGVGWEERRGGARSPPSRSRRFPRRLELAALQRVVRVSAKPTKRLQEALLPILTKHRLSPQQIELRRPGEKQPLDLGKLVSSVAAQRLVLDTLPGVKISETGDTSPCHSQCAPPGTQDRATHPPPLPLNSLAEAPRSVCEKRQTCDIEGLVDMLNRIQSSGAHDQRGLLRKEDLVLPEFLQLPAQGPKSQEAPQQTESSAQPKDSTDHSAL